MPYFSAPECVHARTPLEPTLLHHRRRFLTSYNQPSNRAPPCLVSGYPDTPSRVTAEKGPPLLGFLSLANMLSWLSVF